MKDDKTKEVRDAYIQHLRDTGRINEFVADMFGLGGKPEEIANTMGLSRQAVYNIVDRHIVSLEASMEKAELLDKLRRRKS